MKDTCGSLHLGPATWRAMVDHARRAAPEECCGVLVGVAVDGGWRVESALAARNVATGDRRCRYAIDPVVLLAAHKTARDAAKAVVGYYHSHPASPAVPSSSDLRDALPDACYVIMSLAAVEPETRSWRLTPEGGGFGEVEVCFEA